VNTKSCHKGNPDVADFGVFVTRIIFICYIKRILIECLLHSSEFKDLVELETANKDEEDDN